jgi:arylsulfatase A
MYKIKSVVIILLFAVSFIESACASKSKPETEKPNIIVIFTDDQGYQDLGSYGSPGIKTPRLDQLAREGMRFTDFYVASSVCSPSRAALLTGCYPQRVGVRGVFFPDGEGGLNPEHVTIAEVLDSAGYATAAVGKWHLGDLPEYLPTNQGFDSYYGIPYSNDMYPARDMKYSDDCLWREGYSVDRIVEEFEMEVNKWGRSMLLKNKVPLMRGEECIEFPADQTTLTKRYSEESMKFIENSVNEDEPFFLYLAHTMPHIPIFTTEEFEGTSEAGLYGDCIEEIDFYTGKILDQLKELGIEENTIVVFTSDNGPWLGVGKENEGRAHPLFEGKFTSFEGGMRVPFIIRWPGTVPAGSTCSELSSTIDLLPTLANIAGAELPEKELDGKDVIELWKGTEGAVTPHEYYFMVHDGQAVRSGDWKYHKKTRYTVTKEDDRIEGPALYNLKEDIDESDNVIDQYPEVAERLAKALDNHLLRIQNN